MRGGLNGLPGNLRLVHRWTCTTVVLPVRVSDRDGGCQQNQRRAYECVGSTLFAKVAEVLVGRSVQTHHCRGDEYKVDPRVGLNFAAIAMTPKTSPIT